MTKKMKNFLKGVGSVIDVSPTQNYGHLVPKISPQERMRGHWTRAGKAIQKASDHFAHDQKKK